MTIQISGVRKSFKRRGHAPQDVLRGVDLTIRTGEFVSFIGHSGCGKSTLLNIVGGLVKADGGSVAVDGQVVSGPGPDRAMVFQNYSLLPWLSLLKNVRVAVQESRPDWKKARVDEMVERYLTAVSLWEHRNKRPGQVSGGMAQRAAVARAFAVAPRTLLLDEPFGALDALTRSRLQQQLVDLWDSESETETVLMVTHGLDEAILLADRIVVMANLPYPSVRTVIDVPIPDPATARQWFTIPRTTRSRSSWWIYSSRTTTPSGWERARAERRRPLTAPPGRRRERAAGRPQRISRTLSNQPTASTSARSAGMTWPSRFSTASCQPSATRFASWSAKEPLPWKRSLTWTPTSPRATRWPARARHPGRCSSISEK
ncbi:ABC transporter ATP-binding protein [Luedemannella flava]